ncbi:MAG: hypothetical protein V4713_09465 [Pseudomonadota bacterium]
MQLLQLLLQQRTDIGPVNLRHRLQGAFDFMQRVGLRLLHHFAHRLFDQVAVGRL